ncbi:MAG TPA: DUF1566 domain-containing protein [Burkholderiaceae bacterium]|nr:DUF1566 domain-containing protein [Burkholderiaceae bacterium]
MNTLKSDFRQLYSIFLLVLTTLISMDASAQNTRYSLTNDGTAVMDSKTSLIWKRCEEGKTWTNGMCRGLGIKYNWSDVEKLNASPWRLPTADELKSLKEDTGVAPPINREYFPNTDRAWFWTSSAGVRDASGCIQIVYFGDDIERRCPLMRGNTEQLALRPAFVRLVRSAN